MLQVRIKSCGFFLKSLLAPNPPYRCFKGSAAIARPQAYNKSGSRRSPRSRYAMKTSLHLSLAFILSNFALVAPAGAQIIPDNTLGSETSIVTPQSPQLDQIDGGAIRGNSLFHSFGQFNINEGAAAYFSNPAAVANIFSRVTGGNPSHLWGTLGVLGDANLYFLNPNGIIFGPNAHLDISGSFFASTANALVLPDGTQFSATNPQPLPLLSVEVRAPVGVVFEGGEGGTIVNAGDLEVGENLTLVGGTVVSTGQLAAPRGEVRLTTVPPVATDNDNSSLSQFLNDGGEGLGVTVTDAGEVKLTESGLAVERGDIALAGNSETASVQAATATLAAANTLTLAETTLETARDLNLRAADTVRIRDSQNVPFLAQAGGNLSIQGNESIDILALNHPQTPFQSGGNLSLISDGIISGDAHFTSGGTFSVLNLAGEPGEFVSLYDPIISSESDVVLGDYTGVALKVESRGSIATGDVTITGPDTSLTPNSDPDIDILRSEPALILRAGVDELQNPPNVPGNTFTGNVGPQWSNTSVDTTPIGNRPFLGQFGNETVSLTLDNLPSHDRVNVSFDLFIIKSWDGNDLQDGPDIWQLDVAGGSRLFYTTFSHTLPRNLPQSYPAAYNSSNPVNNLARTGAIERDNSLGYFFDSPSARRIVPVDSVYRLNRSFSHSDSQLQLDFFKFSPNGDNRISDESWGLTNVNITLDSNISLDIPLPSVSKPDFTSLATISPGTITTGDLSTPNGPIILSAASDIILNGSITSQGGRINLDSSGTIDAREGNLDSFSTLDGGEITVNADGDIFLSDIRSSGDRFGGNINIESKAGIYIDEDDLIRSNTFRTYRGGDINVTAQSLLMTNGARILTGAFNDAVGGNLTVTADKVELVGSSADGEILTVLSTATAGTEPAGNLTIDARQLIVRDGAAIAAAVVGGGQGGNLTVRNAELVELSGTSITGFPSGLNTDSLGTGNAGNLIIDTERFIARNGAAASASTYASGRGGNLIVNAASVEFSGTSRDGFASGLYAQAFSDGSAGNLILNAGDLVVRDGAKVTVATGTAADARVPNTPSFDLGFSPPPFDPDPTGDAGNIEITANTILLDREGKIIAQTEASEGGNIGMRVSELLLLRRNSTISATAGTAQAGGNGGNITIDAPFIVAVPRENSDITANAFLGNGGRVEITTRAIYGLQFRPRLTPLSDITASSEFGLDGTVTIDLLAIDPTQGLNSRPVALNTPELLRGCPSGRGSLGVSYFEVGNGGLPPKPEEPLSMSPVSVGWLPLSLAQGENLSSKDSNSANWETHQLVRLPCQENRTENPHS
ncbi:MAG: filamentous hemagglutinin N-terminal domain-containing protein [Cyanobacteriota bacterium]|nr:filamentous hemagglutinin N-terminal domain-containing protein [Cyanobacteriota bacterium]